MKDIFKFVCGDTVKEKISGFNGVVTARCELFSRNIRYYIRPAKLGTDGKPHEGSWQDEDGLDLVKKSKEKREPRAFKFGLGDEVKDSLSDHAGTIIARSDHIRACTTYSVQQRELTKDGKLPDSIDHDEKALLLVKAAVPSKQSNPTADRTGAEFGRNPTARRDPKV